MSTPCHSEVVPHYLRNVLSEVVHDLNHEVVMGSDLMVNKMFYSKGTVILRGIENDGPQFAEVRHALFCNGRYYLICQDLSTEYFSVHYHAYVVARVNNLALFQKSQLVQESSLALYHIPKYTQYSCCTQIQSILDRSNVQILTVTEGIQM